MKKRTTPLLILLLAMVGSTQAQLTFSSPDSLFAYAERNGNTAKVLQQQSLIAKWTKVAALANTVNFKSPLSFSATDNILLPVNFIPAEAFGGPAGSFREITLGQQYVNNFNINPQIDVINPQNWARVKSAETNQQLTEVNNAIARKALRESIAAAYFNCVSLNSQIVLAAKSLVNADSLFNIVKNKYENGIAREQDLNTARINKLSTADKEQQLNMTLQQQLNTLRILCDIPASTAITIQAPAAEIVMARAGNSTLEARQALLQSRFMRSELSANRFAMLPVLSLVYYQGWQYNSNTAFSDNTARWIQSRYLGLRLTVPFPPDANRLSQSYTSKANYKISQFNAAHAQLQSELQNNNLNVEQEKARQSYETSQQVAQLRQLNYDKSLNQYKAGILPAEALITAFNELLNAQLTEASQKAAFGYANTRILINTSFK